MCLLQKSDKPQNLMDSLHGLFFFLFLNFVLVNSFQSA